MNKKEQLIQVFESSKKYGVAFVAVAIKTVGNPDIEVIVNPYVNFEAKKKYYKNAYDDNLVLKSFKGISIVSALGFDSDVEWEDVISQLDDEEWFD